MSFDRCFSRSILLVSAFTLLWSAAPTARADDTWHNIYHSLKRFFTGSSGSSPSPSHRGKRSTNHERANQSKELASTTPESSPEPGASPTPRVVILPAASPVSGSEPAIVNPTAKPETASNPEPKPNSTPVLLSLPGPRPVANPKLQPSATPATGNATSN